MSKINNPAIQSNEFVDPKRKRNAMQLSAAKPEKWWCKWPLLLAGYLLALVSIIGCGSDDTTAPENPEKTSGVVRGTGLIGEGVSLTVRSNGEWDVLGSRERGFGAPNGGKVHSPSGFGPDLWFRAASTPTFPGALDTLVEWSPRHAMRWEGAVHGSDNWMKVIRDSDGCVSWAQFTFDFATYDSTGISPGDPQPILIDIPLYVTREDCADFTLAEAVAAAGVPDLVVQIDVTSVINDDLIVNNGFALDVTQAEIGSRALITESAAKQLGPSDSHGLPDHGYFAADAFHPVVQLTYSNGLLLSPDWNAHVFNVPMDSITFDIPAGSYQELHLFMTSGFGSSEITVSLHYSDTTIDGPTLTVPDWFNSLSPPSASLYYLIDDLGRASGDASLYDAAHQAAIFGLRIDPDGTRMLEAVTVRQTSLTGELAFFGATAVR